MSAPLSRSHPRLGHCRGSTLVVALFILLLLSILGVSAMQTTVLQERMAGNLRDKQLSFQAAEAALREGETWLRDTVALPQFAGANGRYQPDNGLWKDIDWSDTSAVIVYPDNAANPTIDQVAGQPRYYIEELPAADLPGESMVDGYQPNQNNPSYRITARGVGGSSSAVSVLQSTYVR
ncbi:MAG TPA: PilX N-terminal domain-containing pilus assembly protein [Gammaproteobacteria bacterium]|nr:PilX N-terminal domain-containing pilus assembly protein [Gammaproteobacteria bacterium]